MPKPIKAAQWSKIIDLQEASGLSVRSFAEANGLTRGRLTYWRRKLGRTRLQAKPAFVAVVVEDEPADNRRRTVTIHLQAAAPQIVVDDLTDLPLLRRILDGLC